jgi:hypothetical protein
MSGAWTRAGRFARLAIVALGLTYAVLDFLANRRHSDKEVPRA